MKVVLDTNVLMSGIFFGGAPGKVLSAWRHGTIRLFLTPLILDEYRRVGEELSRRHHAHAAGDILDLIALHASVLSDTPLATGICRDPDDDKFIACACAAHAVLVSGDKDLLAVNDALGVRILRPRTLLDLLA